MYRQKYKGNKGITISYKIIKATRQNYEETGKTMARAKNIWAAQVKL